MAESGIAQKKRITAPVSGTALVLIDVINDLAFERSAPLVAQLAAGLAEYNAEQQEHGQPLVTLGAYVHTGHPWAALLKTGKANSCRWRRSCC